MVGSVATCIVLSVLSFVPVTEASYHPVPVTEASYHHVPVTEDSYHPRLFISSGSAVTVNSSVITWVSAIVGAIILGSLLYIAYASVAETAPPGGYGSNYRYKRTTYEQCEFCSSNNYPLPCI